MAKSSSGRFTPKATEKAKVDALKSKAGDAAKEASEKVPGYQTSGRYTPPQPVKVTFEEGTKHWVPYAMFGMFGVGLFGIILNYLGYLPSSPSNWYLLGGLVAITGGFMVATQLK
jgi:Cell division protein CrgA